MDKPCCTKPGIFARVREASKYYWNQSTNDSHQSSFLVTCQKGLDPSVNNQTYYVDPIQNTNVENNAGINQNDQSPSLNNDYLFCYNKDGSLKDIEECKSKFHSENNRNKA